MIRAKGIQRIRVSGCEELRSDRLGLSLDFHSFCKVQSRFFAGFKKFIGSAGVVC